MSHTHNHSGNGSSSNSTSIGRRVFRGVIAGGVALAIASMTAGGIAALQYRASNEQQPLQHPPLPVTALPIKVQDHYVTRSRYVGRLEPARQTDLAF